jgi:bacterioferritin (cytochrome b1)
MRIANSLRRMALEVDRSTAPSRRRMADSVKAVISAVESAPVGPGPADEVAPTGELIAHLQRWLGDKYAKDAAYRSFADRVRGPWRDSLVAHWQEHAGEERQHCYDLAMRIVGLGADPIQTYVKIPTAPANDVAFFKILLSMEMSSISAAEMTIKLAGANQSLKVMAENMMLTDQQHHDDLLRMMPGQQ